MNNYKSIFCIVYNVYVGVYLLKLVINFLKIIYFLFFGKGFSYKLCFLMSQWQQYKQKINKIFIPENHKFWFNTSNVTFEILTLYII